MATTIIITKKQKTKTKATFVLEKNGNYDLRFLQQNNQLVIIDIFYYYYYYFELWLCWILLSNYVF